MSIELLFLTLVLAALLFLIFKQSKPKDADSSFLQIVNDLRREIQDSSNTQRKEVHDRLDNMHERLVKNMTDSSSAFQKHFKHTSTIIRDVTERLTKLDDTNTQVLKFSEQLGNLEKILKNPKQRGILGEYWLESLLNQVLPPGQFKMQHNLGIDEKNCQKLIPDAVIFIKDLIVPIDAKFSLENYNRVSQETDEKKKIELERLFKSDVKMRIDETSKYIKPELGTTNFAFMFVPAEGVYHNLITSNVGSVKVNTRNLIEYAFEKGVMLVSPTSFFAYLQTVILGLKALQIEDSVKEIQGQAENLIRHMKAYEDHHNRVGKHLQTTIRAYQASSGELKKVDKDVFKITKGEAGKILSPMDLRDADEE